MTLVSGPLSTVTADPTAVSVVQVSVQGPRTAGTGVQTHESKNVAVSGGVFSHEIAPGPAMLTMIVGQQPGPPIPILVDDVTSQTLAEVVDAARLATGYSAENLAQFVQQVLEARSYVFDVVEGFGKVEDVVTRVTALEAMSGLSPESPVDGQTANLLNQTGSLTRRAVDVAMATEAPGHLTATNPPPELPRLVADANYYHEESFTYWTDSSMTTPATDNRPALQAMVDYLYAQGGGTIILPAGKMVVRGEIIWRSRVSMHGAGKTASVLLAEGELFSVIKHDPELSSTGSSADDPNLEWLEDVTFSDFAIDNRGLSHPDQSVSGKAFFLLYMKRALFQNLSLVNTIGTALGCDFLIDTVIESVTVRRAGRNGRSGYGGNSGIGIGTAAAAKEPLVVSNCFTYDCGNFGIFVETQHNPAGHRAEYAKIIGCHAEGNYRGFGNKGSGPTQWIGCTSVDNDMMGFELLQEARGDMLLGCVSKNNGGDGVQVGRTYLGNLSIIGCTITDNGGRGIYFDGASSTPPILDTLISGCKITGNGLGGTYVPRPISGLSYTGNMVAGNGTVATINADKRGMYIYQGSSKITVTGNTFFDDKETKTQVAAVQIYETATDVLISGNNAVGYSQTTAYSVPTSATLVGNSPSRESRGTAQIPEGISAMWVNHYLGRIPTEISLTPLGDSRVWIAASEKNRMQIMRPAESTGALSVMWKIS